MNKEEIIKRGSAEHVLSERRLLEEAQSPFIVNMRYAFQDDEHLLMILDLKLGGDLRFHLTYKGAFVESRAKFYFAEVSCALGYLHELKIVHRDIKPDNILLDELGHASVTDFNVACHYRDEKPMHSKSGTARYMAPEVVSGTGYLNQIDWWSLGITTFEMIYGHPPFRARHKDELRKAIQNDPVEFPKTTKSPVSEVAIRFLTELLTRPLPDRLGSNENGGYAKIRAHDWFKDTDWKKIENKEVPVPFKPDASGDGTTSMSPSGVSPSSPMSVDAAAAAATAAVTSPEKKKFFLSPKKEELPMISSAEELQLQLFETKYTVYDFTKPKPANAPAVEINTEDITPPTSIEDLSILPETKEEPEPEPQGP
ncbi:hypothetical protein HDU98_011155 [Podochytrium sp. JEL0797]|nr:hypothetical protein HDU98_011155 [Podochytrium sp. JEL0797]